MKKKTSLIDEAIAKGLKAASAIVYLPDGGDEYIVGVAEVVEIRSAERFTLQILFKNGTLHEFYNIPNSVTYKAK